MKSDVKEKKRVAGFATILTALLAGMTFVAASSTYAASEGKNVVQVKAAAAHPTLPPKVLVFPIVIKEAIVKVRVEKTDSKLPADRNKVIRNPLFLRNQFFFNEAFEEFD